MTQVNAAVIFARPVTGVVKISVVGVAERDVTATGNAAVTSFANIDSGAYVLRAECLDGSNPPVETPFTVDAPPPPQITLTVPSRVIA